MQKLLIGIMEYGEADFVHCLQAINNQATDFDWFIIRNQKYTAVHQMLYKLFDEQKNNYCGLLKLDADMVLYPETLQKLTQTLHENPQISQIKSQLWDFLTQMRIPGIICYTKNCQFIIDADNLIPDHDPIITSGYTHYNYEPVGDHMAYCDLAQAYRYGFIRMMKTLQSDRKHKELAAVFIEWTLLAQCYSASLIHKDKRRDYALMGGLDVFNATQESLSVIYQGNYPDLAKQRIKELANIPPQNIDQYIKNNYENLIILASQLGQKLRNNPVLTYNHTKEVQVNWQAQIKPQIHPKSDLPLFIEQIRLELHNEIK